MSSVLASALLFLHAVPIIASLACFSIAHKKELKCRALHSILRRKVVMRIMVITLEPYKNREHVLAEIRFCARMAQVFTLCAFLFVALGVISDALNTVLVLHPTMWLLWAITCGITVMVSHMHIMTAKQVLGIGTESEEK